MAKGTASQAFAGYTLPICSTENCTCLVSRNGWGYKM